MVQGPSPFNVNESDIGSPAARPHPGEVSRADAHGRGVQVTLLHRVVRNGRRRGWLGAWRRQRALDRRLYIDLAYTGHRFELVGDLLGLCVCLDVGHVVSALLALDGGQFGVLRSLGGGSSGHGGVNRSVGKERLDGESKRSRCADHVKGRPRWGHRSGGLRRGAWRSGRLRDDDDLATGRLLSGSKRHADALSVLLYLSPRSANSKALCERPRAAARSRGRPPRTRRGRGARSNEPRSFRSAEHNKAPTTAPRSNSPQRRFGAVHRPSPFSPLGKKTSSQFEIWSVTRSRLRPVLT